MKFLSRIKHIIATAIVSAVLTTVGIKVLEPSIVHIVAPQSSAVNGVTWNEWTPGEKYIYLSGLSRGMLTFAVDIRQNIGVPEQVTTPLEQRIWFTESFPFIRCFPATTTTVGGVTATVATAVNRAIDADVGFWVMNPRELVKDLDEYYTQPEHRMISVVDAIAAIRK